MKRIHLIAAVLGIVAVSLGCFFAGCKKESSGAGLKSGFVSAEQNSFKEVTPHLDAGGNLYVYLSTEQLLRNISGKVSGWRQILDTIPDLTPEQKANAGKAFDIVTSLIKDSGIEDVSGFGMSSIATEKGFYHTKVLIHHYASQGSGFLWKLFGEKPHALDGLQMLPANTAIASFSDVDVPLVWSELQKQVGQSGFPQAAALLDKLPENFERATGLKWQRVLDSLGGEFGLVLTLDDAKKIPIPLPSQEKLEIPEPGLMIVAKVKDDTIFNRVDEALQKRSQQVIRADNGGLKMLTVPVPLPVPIQLRPSIATSGGYLFVATSDALIQQALAVKSGNEPGLQSTDEFKRLAKNVPDQGNQFSFVSQRFSQTLFQVQRQALEMNPKAGPAQKEFLASFLQPEKAGFSYCVGANTDDGWYSVGNGNQNPGNVLLASAVALPVGLLSAIAIPNFVKARATAQRNACISNLRRIEAAKQKWAQEKGKTDTDVPTWPDLEPYLGHPGQPPPQCPAGGHYTIGAVGQQPTCSIPGHQLKE